MAGAEGVVLLAAAPACPAVRLPTPHSWPHSPQTYAPDQGACGYGALPPGQWPFGGIAAIDPLASPFAAGVQQGCGVCLEVQCTDPAACGTSQSLLVLVTDHCNGCGAGSVYLAPSAFQQLVPGPLGSVAGRVRRVRTDFDEAGSLN